MLLGPCCLVHVASCIGACRTLPAARCMVNVACLAMQVVFCMSHAACCTLCVACCMLQIVFCMLQAECCMLHARMLQRGSRQDVGERTNGRTTTTTPNWTECGAAKAAEPARDPTCPPLCSSDPTAPRRRSEDPWNARHRVVGDTVAAQIGTRPVSPPAGGCLPPSHVKVIREKDLIRRCEAL